MTPGTSWTFRGRSVTRGARPGSLKPAKRTGWKSIHTPVQLMTYPIAPVNSGIVSAFSVSLPSMSGKLIEPSASPPMRRSTYPGRPRRVEAGSALGLRRRARGDLARRPPGRLDVLVQTEQVLGVVAVLERLKAGVRLGPERRLHAILALLADEVEVDATGGVRLHRRPELPGPGDVRLVACRVRPHREDVDVERRRPLAEGHPVVRDPCDLAAAGHDDGLGERGRLGQMEAADGLDRLLGQPAHERGGPV